MAGPCIIVVAEVNGIRIVASNESVTGAKPVHQPPLVLDAAVQSKDQAEPRAGNVLFCGYPAAGDPMGVWWQAQYRVSFQRIVLACRVVVDQREKRGVAVPRTGSPVWYTKPWPVTMFRTCR